MIKLYARKNDLTVTRRELLTSGSVGVNEVEFAFSADWDGLARRAVFRGGSEVREVALSASGRCEIPWEVLAQPERTVYAGVYGTGAEGRVVLPTVWASLGSVLEGAGRGEDARPPTPDLWEQELAKKGDGLRYDGVNLSLMSGEEALSTVQVAGGGGGVVPVPGPQGPAGEDALVYNSTISVSDISVLAVPLTLPLADFNRTPKVKETFPAILHLLRLGFLHLYWKIVFKTLIIQICKWIVKLIVIERLWTVY